MNTIHELEQLIHTAEQSGYRIRYDYFGGTGGGSCTVGNQKWIFIDLALTSAEQLTQLKQTLASDPLFHLANAERAA
jgi:hypothetical protein